MKDAKQPNSYVTSGEFDAKEISQIESGLDPDFFDFNNALDELYDGSKITSGIDTLDKQSIPNGHLYRFGLKTKSGHSYSAAVGMPTAKQSSDIPIIQTGAWLTSSMGHNEHTLRTFVNNGTPFFFVGPEGSYHSSCNSLKPEFDITLAKSAAAVLRFSQIIPELFDVNITDRALIGESRGAMVGMGVLALDSVFGQKIIFADLIAPCFPRKLEPSDALKLSGHLFHEPVSILKLAFKLGIPRLIHYPSTIDLHPTALLSQIAIGPALFSGEAGELAKLIENDKIIHITCFNDDFASMPKEWQEIFIDNDNIRITILDGSHLTIADPETLNYLIARKNSLSVEIEQYGKNLDGQRIFDRAHQLV
jgi:hypothetical protein